MADEAALGDTINDTDEPVEPYQGAVDYWRNRWANAASALADSQTLADLLADRLRSAYAVIERMKAAQFNPAILDRMDEALAEYQRSTLEGPQS